MTVIIVIFASDSERASSSRSSETATWRAQQDKVETCWDRLQCIQTVARTNVCDSHFAGRVFSVVDSVGNTWSVRLPRAEWAVGCTARSFPQTRTLTQTVRIESVGLDCRAAFGVEACLHLSEEDFEVLGRTTLCSSETAQKTIFQQLRPCRAVPITVLIFNVLAPSIR